MEVVYRKKKKRATQRKRQTDKKSSDSDSQTHRPRYKRRLAQHNLSVSGFPPRQFSLHINIFFPVSSRLAPPVTHPQPSTLVFLFLILLPFTCPPSVHLSAPSNPSLTRRTPVFIPASFSHSLLPSFLSFIHFCLSLLIPSFTHYFSYLFLSSLIFFIYIYSLPTLFLHASIHPFLPSLILSSNHFFLR